MRAATERVRSAHMEKSADTTSKPVLTEMYTHAQSWFSVVPSPNTSHPLSAQCESVARPAVDRARSRGRSEEKALKGVASLEMINAKRQLQLSIRSKIRPYIFLCKVASKWPRHFETGTYSHIECFLTKQVLHLSIQSLSPLHQTSTHQRLLHFVIDAYFEYAQVFAQSFAHLLRQFDAQLATCNKRFAFTKCSK